MPVNSRQKGRAFEQRIARDLREWLGDEWTVKRLRPDEQRGPIHAGEFAITGPWDFALCIECKTSKAWKESHLWSDPIPGPLASTASQEGYWAQAVRQAQTVGKRPMLVLTRPRGPILAIMRPELRLLLRGVTLPRHRFDLDSEPLEAILWADVISALPGALHGL